MDLTTPPPCLKTFILSQKVDYINEMFEFPRVINSFEELSDADNSSIEDFAGLLTNDPITASGVIKLANSPLYSAKGNITTLNKAIMVLGTKKIKELLYLDLTGRIATIGKIKNEDLKHYWVKSLTMAVSSRMIARLSRHREIETMFTTGLLSLIGELAMLGLNESMHITNKENVFPWKQQIEQRGYSDINLSTALLTSWRLPKSMVLAIEEMHVDSHVDLNKDVRVLKAATTLTEEMLSNRPTDWDRLLESPSLKFMSATKNDLEMIMAASEDIATKMLPEFLTRN